MAGDDSSNEQGQQCEQSDEPKCGESDEPGCGQEHSRSEEQHDSDERDENDYSLGATEVLLASHTFAVGKTLADVETEREIPAWQGKLIIGAIFAFITAIAVAIAVNGI